MFETLSGTKIFYQRQDGEGRPVLLLHGWGASAEAMGGIYRFLAESGRTVLAPDLPGFGQSDLPPETWGIYEYADSVQAFMAAQNIQAPVIIGHSFGGRIALILASRGLADSLVLTDAAGLKPKFSFKKQCRVFFYKLGKRFGRAPKGAGSADYRALPQPMKPVFVRVVNTHLDCLLPKIQVPTLLIWGEEDRDTPLYMAKRLEKKIAGSGLVVFKGCGHFAYAENHTGFCLTVKAFLER